MKVIDLELTNFARVYTGMGITHLYIDFTIFTNRIFLFIGRNGTGKTSVLRCIHPFAYNAGVGDSTSNPALILKGEDGKKVIRYEDNGSIYKITHLYLRKKDDSLTVKSFIEKDGEELNESGTVTTFKNIIQEIFQIDISFLSLISLGNTITGFVEFASAERKQLAIKIFEELDIFNTYYKNASAEAREKKSLLSNITIKLDRYKAYDQADLKSEYDQLDGKKSELNDQLSDLMKNAGAILQKIEDNNEFISEYTKSRDTLNQLFDEIDSLKSKITISDNEISAKNQIEELTSTLTQMKINVSALEMNIKSEMDLKDNKLANKSSLETNIQRMSNDVDIQEMEELKASLQKELVLIESNLEGVTIPDVSADNLIRASVYLQELYGMCIDLVTGTTNEELVIPTLKRYISNNKFYDMIQTKLTSVQNKIEQYELVMNNGVMTSQLNQKKIDTECEEECAYKTFYHTYMQFLSKKNSGLMEDHQKDQEELHIAENTMTILKVIKNLYSYINKNSDYFGLLPVDIFDPQTFIVQYMDKRTIYDQNLLSTQIDALENMKRKNEIESRLKDISKSLSTMEANRDTLNDMERQLISVEEDLDRIESNITRYRKDYDFNKEEITNHEYDLTRYQMQYEHILELKEKRAELDVVKHKLADMESTMEEIQTLQGRLTWFKTKESEIRNSITQCEERQRTIQLILTTIKDLETEEIELSKQYHIAELVKKAASPSKGVPLKFIDYYIKGSLISMVNELLDSVYHGALRLRAKDTIIDESEFRIPYERRGTLVGDISNASDGERAILTLAFSLAFIRLYSNKDTVNLYYNILLLDELDTALDVHTRPIFIQMIENFMGTIHAEQVFLISHNSTFDVYPVNVLLTSDEIVSNMTSAEVMRLYEQRAS